MHACVPPNGQQSNLSLGLTFTQRRLLQIRSQNSGSGFDPGNKLSERTMGPGKHFCSLRLLATWCGHDRSVCVYIPKRRICRPASRSNSLSLRRVCTQPAARNSRNISCQDKYGAGKSKKRHVINPQAPELWPVRNSIVPRRAHFPAQVLLYLLCEHRLMVLLCARGS
jgi:hypothetical protein